MFSVAVALLIAASPLHPFGAGMLETPKHGSVFVVAHPTNATTGTGLLEKVTTLAGYGVDFVSLGVREDADGTLLAVADAGGADEVPSDKLSAVLDAVKGKCGVLLSTGSAAPAKILALVRDKDAVKTTLFRGKAEVLNALAAQCPECLRLPEAAGMEGLSAVLVDREARVNTGRTDGRRGRLLGKAPKPSTTLRPPAVAVDAAQFSAEFAAKCRAADVLPFVSASGEEAWRKTIKDGAAGIETDHPRALIKLLQGESAASK